MNFETIIGLEVHIELKTKSKIFSPSPVKYGADPNTQTNVIDWGYPGTLPIVNKEAYSLGILIALALHMKISHYTHFDRKNYFYPDNPKGYQITQSEYPLGHDGWIEIESKNGIKRIGITELHIEEDAGKNTHGNDGYSYIDLNRQGTPLVEIVSKPDISSPEEAYLYLEKLRQIVQFTGASDVKMEEGSMRVDSNLSIRPIGSNKYGVKTELKNLNSFVKVRDGLTAEEKRQCEVIISGKSVRQETRRFNIDTGKTELMRTKEHSEDYRYFPEPDLPPLNISDEWINSIKNILPEMPDKRRERYIKELGIPAYDANVLTYTKEMSDFFEKTISYGADPKLVSNWLMVEVNSYLNANKMELLETKLTPEHLASMIKLIMEGTISSKIAKKVFNKIISEDIDPVKWVKDNKLIQISDVNILMPIINDVLDNNYESIVSFKNGKDRALGFLIGQIMKQTHGKANPKAVNKLLLNELNKRINQLN